MRRVESPTTQATREPTEEGLPRDELNRDRDLETEIDRYLVDHVGYNPEAEDYDTFGSLDVETEIGDYGEEMVSVTYEIRRNLALPEDAKADDVEAAFDNLFNDVDSATLEDKRDSYLKAQFNYSEVDWIRTTEEVGDAVVEFEDSLGLYSGR